MRLLVLVLSCWCLLTWQHSAAQPLHNNNKEPIDDEESELAYERQQQWPEESEFGDELELELENPQEREDEDDWEQPPFTYNQPQHTPQQSSEVEDGSHEQEGESSEEEQEIELEPAAPINEEADMAQRNKKMARIARQGQMEFENFVDPDLVAARKVDQQEVNVKRATTLHFNDDNQRNMAMGNFIFLVVVGMCTAMAMVGLVVGGAVYYRIHKQNLAAQESEYPVYGVVGPTGKAATGKATARGDQRMAYSAQLHHYQQTKQKIISMEQSGMDQRDRESDASDDEGDEGDYSVYECPGLAPTGDIEVSNPMFEKSKSGATTPVEPKSKK